MNILIKTLEGLEGVLKDEVVSLGLKNVESGKRIVSCEGQKEDIYRLNLGLYTGLRVLVPFYSFEANGEEELYDKLRKFDWEKYLSLEKTFAIDATTNSEVFTHSKYVAYKMKDAISDFFRDKYSKRPSVDTSYPDVRFNIHINANKVSLSIDSSGDILYKRGYRVETNEAPLNEVLAAGILKLSGWQGDTDLYDPMCGSGTFLIEAACIATNRPPCLLRKRFGFMTWQDFDQDLFERVKKELISEVTDLTVEISGADKAMKTIRSAEKNISKALFDKKIIVKRGDFFRKEPPESAKFVFMNPPYGQRLELADAKAFYANMGDVFKRFYQDKRAFVITSNLEAFKFLGLRPSSKKLLFNGPLECRLHEYEVYAGSKKAKFNN